VSEAVTAGHQAAAEDLSRVLAPRQREIAAPVAAGCSDARIVGRLVITQGTVANEMDQNLRRLTSAAGCRSAAGPRSKGPITLRTDRRRAALPHPLPSRLLKYSFSTLVTTASCGPDNL
jgi:DNA-binding NarL/FixJ family response regulator